MFIEQIRVNREKAFRKIATRKGAVSCDFTNERYSYATKRGIVHKFMYFNSFNEYKNSEYYPSKDERCNGFIFVMTE